MPQQNILVQILGRITGLRRRGRVVVVATCTVLAVGMLGGCVLPTLHSSPPAWPDADNTQWRTYTREDVGLTIEAPADFVARQVGDDTVFNYGNYPILRVLLVDETAARQRGLWVTGLPTDEVEVDGREAQFYSYNHKDFFTYTHTLAYVLPHRGKQLGIEFRTDGQELNATQRRILDSVRLAGE